MVLRQDVNPGSLPAVESFLEARAARILPLWEASSVQVLHAYAFHL